MEIKRLHSECLTCMAKVHMDKCPKDIDEEIKVEYMQKLLKILSEAEEKYGAPVIVRKIKQLQEEVLGIKEDYAEIKKYYNHLMMCYEDQITQKIENSEDPLKMGIQYAMIGNYIDFGARITVTDEHLTELINTPEEFTVDQKQYNELVKDLNKAKTLLYLTDNCGEIVMDKILIKQIKNKYPELEITVMVRGDEVVNDASMKDAVQVGMCEIVKVITNGSDIAGTWIEEISSKAKAVMDEADIIISKGQGNFETLRKCGKNIYYIFLCKCDLFSRLFQVPKLTGMLIHDKYC